MQKLRVWRNLKFLLVGLVVLGVVIGIGTGTALAVTSSSNNYQLTESEFTTGGNLQSCSGQYCSQTSTGNIGGGGDFDNVNGDDAVLEVIIESGISDLGVLSTQSTATKTTIVKVRSLQTGYTMQIIGAPPTYDGHALNTLTEPTASILGQEQFGINIVANTTPSFGANPNQVPKVETSFGQMIYGEVTENYGQQNKFMYASGDTVARSRTDSGRTDYTVSMILNISSETPAGRYTGDFSAIVMPSI